MPDDPSVRHNPAEHAPARPLDSAEIRRSLEALPRMLPTMLEGIAEDQLLRSAPGRPVPLPAVREHLAHGAALLARLVGLRDQTNAGGDPERAQQRPLPALVEAFRAQRQEICGFLDSQGERVWTRHLPLLPGPPFDSAVGRAISVQQACADLVVADRSLLGLLGQHRNWLKGR